MPYPRLMRAAAPRRSIDHGALAAACDADCPVQSRVAALWRLEGAGAGDVVDGRTLAQRLGAILNEPNVVAFEAYECLASLYVEGKGSALDELAVGVDGAGVVVVPRARFSECVAAEDGTAWCADLDIPVVKLRDIQRLADRTSATVVKLPAVVEGVAVVVERAAHAGAPARAVRLRGNDVVVGAAPRSVLRLPLARRNVRFLRREQGDWHVADYAGDGGLSLGDGRPLDRSPVLLADGAVIVVHDDQLQPITTLTARFVPRLDRRALPLRISGDNGPVEQLAFGEALFLGPDDADDYFLSERVRIVGFADEPLVLGDVRSAGVVVDCDLVRFRDDEIRGWVRQRVR